MSTEIAKTREELELEKAVFGDVDGFEKALLNIASEEGLDESGEDNASASEDDEDLYFIDKGSESDSDQESDTQEAVDTDSDSSDDAAVWHDSDDDNIQVDLSGSTRIRKLRKSLTETAVSGREYEARLRSHFERLYPKPVWSKSQPVALHEDPDMESDEDLDDKPIRANPLKDILNSSTSYLSSTKLKLIPKSDIDIQRLADVTKQLQSHSVVQCVDFHPTRPLVLTAGFDKTLRIYQIDGKSNALATSLYIENCPFQTAFFHPDGRRVIAGGRRKYLFIWDLESGTVEKVSRLYGQEYTQQSFEKFVLSPCGQYISLLGQNGWMNLVSAESGQWLSGAKIEGNLVDIAWTEPETITLVNSQGDVWTWDVASRAMKSRWRDPSLVGVTKVAQSASWIALGMESGIVSVYNRRNPIKGTKYSDAEPEIWQANHVVENLVTSIGSMKFNPDGQLLCVSSRLKRDALRIVHVPSFVVYKNWPTSSTPLGNVSCVTWSPQGKMLVAGNEGGYVRLWSLNHYQ